MASRSFVQRARSAVIFSAQLRHFALDLVEALLAGGVGLALQRRALDFERCGLALQLIDLGGHGADLDGQRRGGLVDKVNGLVGQESGR